MYTENTLTIANHDFTSAQNTKLFNILWQFFSHLKKQWAIIATEGDVAYSAAEKFLQQIKSTTLHVVDNSRGPLDNFTVLGILLAMILHKPIILLNQPKFAKNIDLFSKEVILKRLNKILICDLTMLESTDLREFLLNSVQSVNYVMTKHEVVLIRAKLRTYFRSLL